MKSFKRLFKFIPLIVFALFVIVANVYAGTGGTEFTALYDLISGWTTGMLGKTLALSCFLVGMGFSVVQQSLVPVAVGIGAAAALAYTPAVLEGVITATIC
jgi:conjugal transfer pilus assembly protein TraA